MATEPSKFLNLHTRAIARLHRRGHAGDFGLGKADLGAALYRSVRSWNANADAGEINQYLGSLNIEDFVLAHACARGNELAWKRFSDTYWPVLYRAAVSLIPDDEADVRGLAESLWGEIHGIEVQAGEQRSLLAYFGGRSSLGIWLRTVLAQRWVDLTRTAARNKRLWDDFPEAPSDGDAADSERARYVAALNTALVAALEALEPRDRLRLSYYYLENLTLREIARLLAEHPSGVSRRLRQTRLDLKREVEGRLRGQENLSEEQIRLCYDYLSSIGPSI